MHDLTSIFSNIEAYSKMYNNMSKLSGMLGLVALTALVVSSCTKSTNNAVAVSPTTGVNPGSAPPSVAPAAISVNTLFAELRTTPETQCVTAGAATTIDFANGTRISLYDNSFTDTLGAPITSGTVCLEVTEVYTAGSQIRNRYTTVATDGRLMRNGGQVQIKATKDGVTVLPTKYKIVFKHPASIEPTDIFLGVINRKDSVIQWNRNNLIGPGTAVPATANDGGTLTGYVFDSAASFGWISAGKFYTTTAARTAITLKMPNVNYNDSNTAAFVVLPDVKGLVPVSTYYRTWLLSQFSTTSIIPVGMPVKIVVLNKQGADYFYYETETTVTATQNMVVEPVMIKQTLAWVIDRLAAM